MLLDGWDHPLLFECPGRAWTVRAFWISWDARCSSATVKPAASFFVIELPAPDPSSLTRSIV